MSTATSFLASNCFSAHQWSSQSRAHERAKRSLTMKSQQQELELEEAPSQEQNQGSLPQQPEQQKAASPVESLPRQPNAKSKNMSQEYGGQFLSCTTRHVRIYAAYIDPITHAFDQTQMDKLTLILDPTDEFVWAPDTCQKVYAYFQELVDHYEGAPLSEYTLRLIGSDIEHFIRKMLYDGEIKYNMNARVLNFSMGKPRVKLNTSQIKNVHEDRFGRSEAPAANMFLKPVLILLHLLHQVFYLLLLILHRIGLNPIFETSPPDNQEETLFSAEPSPAVKAAAASIKCQLPVVDFISFIKSKHTGEKHEPQPPPTCAVCLQFMEARDQVRELGNCCHAFHVSCLDRWVDLGRFSCPLCRSNLLPPPAGGRRGPLQLVKLLIAGEATSLVTSC